MNNILWRGPKGLCAHLAVLAGKAQFFTGQRPWRPWPMEHRPIPAAKQDLPQEANGAHEAQPRTNHNVIGCIGKQRLLHWSPHFRSPSPWSKGSYGAKGLCPSGSLALSLPDSIPGTQDPRIPCPWFLSLLEEIVWSYYPGPPAKPNGWPGGRRNRWGSAVD